MTFTHKQIIASPLFQKTAKNFLGEKKSVIINRSGCFFICSQKEGAKIIKRIILLPPHGFTGNKIHLLNPHPEARTAKVRILGKISPRKKGFAPLVREIKFSFSLGREMPTEEDSPYAKCLSSYCGSQLKSWRNWFYMVKENGWGNFHSLSNISNEWVAVLLEKQLVDQRPINLESVLAKLTNEEAQRLERLLWEVNESGDKIFYYPKIVQEILNFPSEILVPALIQMLNVREAGEHEPCTFFGILLKVSKKNKKLVLTELGKALKLKLAPHYYLDDLERKLTKSCIVN